MAKTASLNPSKRLSPRSAPCVSVRARWSGVSGGITRVLSCGWARLRVQHAPDRSSIGVFVGALDPHERLNVDHVAGAEVSQVAAYGSGECKEAFIGRVIRARFITQREAVCVGRGSRHVRLQE